MEDIVEKLEDFIHHNEYRNDLATEELVKLCRALLAVLTFRR